MLIQPHIEEKWLFKNHQVRQSMCLPQPQTFYSSYLETGTGDWPASRTLIYWSLQHTEAYRSHPQHSGVYRSNPQCTGGDRSHPQHTVSVLGRDKGYMVKYNPLQRVIFDCISRVES